MHLEAIWPHIQGYMQSFADRTKGDASVGDFVIDIKQGRRQMWIAWDGEEVRALALTMIEGKSVILNFCAGRDRHEWWRQMIDAIDNWRAQIGGKRLSVICRPGWVKELKSVGFRETHRILERDGQE